MTARSVLALVLALVALPPSAQSVTWEQSPLIPFQASQISDGVMILPGPSTTGPVYAVASKEEPPRGRRLEVFPNPSPVTAHLGEASGETGRAVVTDVRGRVVRTVAVGAGSVTVNVSRLVAGVHHVRTEAGAVARFSVAR